MLVLAIDTCEVRGSVAALTDGEARNCVVHGDSCEGYSSWLLPAVERAREGVFKSIDEVDLLAVATGPGSFTGVRIGLTTVKAWAELFGKPVAAVSRLEVVGQGAGVNGDLVASTIDAGRGQLFGVLHRRKGDSASTLTPEMVLPVDEFVALVGQAAGEAKVVWATTDPRTLENSEAWRARGDAILEVTSVLAPLIGKLGMEKAGRGEVVNALQLDANYVRKSYVEAFKHTHWAGGART